MLWVIPLGLAASYLLFGRKQSETSSEEEAVDTASFPTQAPMPLNMTPAQANAMGFKAPLTTAQKMTAKAADKTKAIQRKMVMKAAISPNANPNVIAAQRAADALKNATPFGWKNTAPSNTAPSNTAPSNPADGIVAFDASASFDLTTKLK